MFSLQLVTKVPATWHTRAILIGASNTHNSEIETESMNQTAVNCEELLLALAECYEHDPSQFVALARQTVDSCFVREIVAVLRNEGYVEEHLRGVIRLTARGYSTYKKRSLLVAYQS